MKIDAIQNLSNAYKANLRQNSFSGKILINTDSRNKTDSNISFKGFFRSLGKSIKEALESSSSSSRKIEYSDYDLGESTPIIRSTFNNDDVVDPYENFSYRGKKGIEAYSQYLTDRGDRD